jgi:hypothetical protein
MVGQPPTPDGVRLSFRAAYASMSILEWMEVLLGHTLFLSVG